MTTSITWRGQEVYGWRRKLAIAVLVIATPVLTILGILWLIVSLPFVLPAGIIYRAIKGHWPEWCKIELG